jgi:hypothetical protein
MSVSDIGTVAVHGTAEAGDALCSVDAGNDAGNRLRRIVLDGVATNFLNGQGELVQPFTFDGTADQFVNGVGDIVNLPGATPVTAVYAGTGLSGGGREGDLVLSLSSATQAAIAANTAKVSFDSSTVLTRTNTDVYTPSANYHPSTKKYVDDRIAANTAGVSQATAGTGIAVSAATGNVTFSISQAWRDAIAANTAKISFDETSSGQLAELLTQYEGLTNVDWDAADGPSAIENKPTAMPNYVATYRHTTTSDYVVGTEDPRECYGGVIYVTNNAKVIAPTISEAIPTLAGMNFTVVTVGAVDVAVDVVDDTKIYLDGTLLDANKGATNTGTNGDIANFTYYPGTGDDAWYVLTGTQSGDVWTAEA